MKWTLWAWLLGALAAVTAGQTGCRRTGRRKGSDEALPVRPCEDFADDVAAAYQEAPGKLARDEKALSRLHGRVLKACRDGRISRKARACFYSKPQADLAQVRKCLPESLLPDEEEESPEVPVRLPSNLKLPPGTRLPPGVRVERVEPSGEHEDGE